MVRYKTIKQFAAESGYTEKAIRAKLSSGTWLEGQVWIRAPDSKPLIDVEGYHAWVESGSKPRRRIPKAGKAALSFGSPPPLV